MIPNNRFTTVITTTVSSLFYLSKKKKEQNPEPVQRSRSRSPVRRRDRGKDFGPPRRRDGPYGPISRRLGRRSDFEDDRRRPPPPPFRGSRRRGGPRGRRPRWEREERPPIGNPEGYERIYENSIFVGNLSFDCTSDDLGDYFSPVGEIVSAEIITNRGRHKGMGTVEFTNPDDVDRAIREFDGTEFMGRVIFVKPDRPPPGGEMQALREEEYMPPRRFEDRVQPNPQGYEVFIINLPYSVTWQDLKDLFRECGDVLRADVELDRHGYSRGFGNVFYATEEEMHRAIERFNGFNFHGRILEVREGRYNTYLHSNDNVNTGNYRTHNTGGFDDRPDEIAHNSLQFSTEDREFERAHGEGESDQQQQQQHDDGRGDTHPPSAFVEGVVESQERNSLVYCKNLPMSTSLNDLYELFESFGEVVQAELVFDPTGIPTGNAVVEYRDISRADLCVEKLNNYNYGGNNLSVSYGERLN